MPSDNCRITQIELYQSRIKLREPFKISLETNDFAESIFLVILTNTGITGFGECSPDLVIQGENLDTCAIMGKYIALHLKGKDPLDIEECHRIMDSLVYGHTGIKSAFDIALYDIAAKTAELPLYTYLGGKKGKKIATDYTISIDSPEKMAYDALKIKEAGFPVIKVKLGQAFKKDQARLAHIRRAIGYDMPLRLDANQGWDMQTAIRLLSGLKDQNIQFCEEPIPRWNYMALPMVRHQSHVPIMADESCFDHHDAKRLIDFEACDYFNIKTGKSSGLFKAMKIIRLSEEAGINLQIGGFIESRLGFTAAAHLALISDQIIFYDFDTPLMMESDPVTGGITYGKNGEIEIPDTPGLGSEIDRKYLSKCPGIIVK
jgi:L-alanine-DL-glutamate epimerase-like enolase superfamily enzyme